MRGYRQYLLAVRGSTPQYVGVRRVAMSVSSMSVCTVCLSASISQEPQSKLHEIFLYMLSIYGWGPVLL